MYSDIDEIANCFTLIVGKNVSSTGHVLVGHNEDDGGYDFVNHGVVSAKEWPEGSIIPCEEGTAKVNQVAKTNKFYWIEFKSAEKGFANADGFYNEYGVFVVSNSCANSKGDTEDPSNVCEGGVTYLIRRSIAERAKTAREGVEIVIDLMKRYGYSSSGRSYTIADKNEAYFMQLARGHYYLGAKVPDDAIVLMPNHYILHKIDECETMFYPEDLIEHAIDMGWYVPKKAGDYSDFDFCKAYQDDYYYMRDYNFLRSMYAQKIVGKNDWVYDGSGCPFAVEPKGKISPLDLFEVLTCHYEGSPYENVIAGPGKAPHNTNVRRICTATTLEANIAVFKDEPCDFELYSAYGRPCVLPFIKIHPMKQIPSGLIDMDDPAKYLEEHFVPDTKVSDGKHPGEWIKFRHFQNLMEMQYSDFSDEVKAMWKDYLRFALESDDSYEKDCELLEIALSKMEEFTEEKLSDAKVLDVDNLTFDNFEKYIAVTFTCKGEPKLKRLILGLEDLGVNELYEKAISVDENEDRSFTAMFGTSILAKHIFRPGCYRAVLGGVSDKAFGALCEIVVK